MLVSTSWLADHLRDRSLVILHVGSSKDYAAGHIPGALRLSLADISVSGPENLRLELPDEGSLQTALGRAGITEESRIVIYPANDSVQSATRVWFTLDYAGLANRASLLDGGLIRWKAEGRPLSTESPDVTPTLPRINLNPEVLASAEWVRDHLHGPGVQIIDARTPEFHSGANPGQMPRAGRIPGAVNLPYNTLLDGQGSLRPAAELRARFAAGKEVVAYCHIGLQATLVYFAARMLGEPVRLYDGSFQDWSRRAGWPVETGQR